MTYIKKNIGCLWDNYGITSYEIPEKSCCETDVLAGITLVIFWHWLRMVSVCHGVDARRRAGRVPHRPLNPVKERYVSVGHVILLVHTVDILDTKLQNRDRRGLSMFTKTVLT